eukprot:2216664-Rhodomonas_salina.1
MARSRTPPTPAAALQTQPPAVPGPRTATHPQPRSRPRGELSTNDDAEFRCNARTRSLRGEPESGDARPRMDGTSGSAAASSARLSASSS